MPNHVENHVIARGPEEEIERLLKTSFRVREGTRDGLLFDFRTLIPVDYTGIEARGMFLPADNARIAAWGTRWIGYDAVIISRQPCVMEFSFTTAWDYPEPVYRKLGVVFPALRFDIAAIDPEIWAMVGCVAGELAVFDRQADMRVVFERVFRESYDNAMQSDI